MWRRNGGRYLRLLWRRRGSFQLRAHAGRLVHSSVPATVPPWAAWASQPILRHSNEDKDLEAVSQECTPEDRRHAAELLFQKKKEAYFSELSTCCCWSSQSIEHLMSVFSHACSACSAWALSSGSSY